MKVDSKFLATLETHCKEIASQYKAVEQFHVEAPHEYHLSKCHNWLSTYDWLTTSDSEDIKTSKWTYNRCYEEAKKYRSRWEFCQSSRNAYMTAYRYGWLNDYFWLPKRLKKNLKQSINKKWTEELCYNEAKKYKTKSEFVKGNLAAYAAARRNGWLNNYTWMAPKYKSGITHYSRWNKDLYKVERKKYGSIKEFRQAMPTLYKIAKRHGWINEPTGHSTWTYERCYEEAKKYTSKTEFRKTLAYTAALRRGWLKDFTWLVPTRGYWTYERCKEEAKKYTTKYDFIKNAPGGYQAAYKNGWLKEFDWLTSKSRTMKS